MKSISRFHRAAFVCIWMVYEYYLWLMIVVRKSSWNLADYLITYADGGFKRRGLSGAMFLAVHDWTGLPLEILVFLFQTLVFSVFLYWVGRRLASMEGAANAGLFFLFFSPYVLTFVLSNESGIGKKEFLFFVLYLLLFKVLRRNALKERWMYGFCLLFIVVLLFHEGLFFYLPYFIVAIFLSDGHTSSYRRRFVLLLVMVSTLIVGFLYLSGGPINQGGTLSLLAERGLEMRENGILNPSWNTYRAVDYFRETGRNVGFSVIYFGLLMVLGCVYFGFICWRFGLFPLRRLLMIWGLTFSCSLPLFYLAADWGRWLFIHFTLTSILILNSGYKPQKGTVRKRMFVMALVVFLLIQVVRVPFILPEPWLSFWFYLADPVRFVFTRLFSV